MTDTASGALTNHLREFLTDVLYAHDPSCGHEDCRRTADTITPLIAERFALCPIETAKTYEQGGALSDIAAERLRQVEAEGWTPEHDDHHDRDLALPRAAACYALAGTGGNGPFWITHLQVPQQVWPYRWEWKPKDRRSNLVRAAALLVAEIERLDRSLTQIGAFTAADLSAHAGVEK